MKRSVMTDARGAPVGLAVAGANVHDVRLLQATVADCFRRFGRRRARPGEHLCLDKGYDSAAGAKGEALSKAVYQKRVTDVGWLSALTVGSIGSAES